ncbi:hypothetical protein PCASD_06937 [Puccinia coronata f. sp. avenae]|uniref:Uncharacterized protein n=2 Tax=Puccinia coronata f. sp. avenae TaxID=200324 RepID=A0A2N5V4R7_9BASI|nr:hypothetical protein PCASD_06937 [Puccinia coronata f. sp. avenae]
MRHLPSNVNTNLFLQGNTTMQTELQPEGGASEEEESDHFPSSQGIAGQRRPTPANDAMPMVTNLMERLNFDENSTSLVNPLFAVPPAQQFMVSVVLQVATLQRLGVVPAPHEAVPEKFVYSNAIRQTLRQKAREIIVFEDVEAYTRTQTVRGLPIRHTPLVLMTAYLESQTPTFKSENLPAGWPTNQLASQSVLSLLRLLLKHERGSLRNLLLTNVKEFHRRPIDGPVPALADLTHIVDWAMSLGNSLRGVTAMKAAYTATVKVRLAYIRLEVIHHHLNPNPANTLSQWEIIDRRLELLRRQSLNYKQAFSRLVVAANRTLFGNLEFANMQPGAIVPPSKSQIQQEMLSASSFQHMDDPTDDLF